MDCGIAFMVVFVGGLWFLNKNWHTIVALGVWTVRLAFLAAILIALLVSGPLPDVEIALGLLWGIFEVLKPK